MPLEVIHGDITQIKAEAIVNAANERLLQGGGVCGAIFAAAGASELREACSRIGFCPTGSAVITDGFRLPAKYIIHTVGSVWQGGGHGEEALLLSCYKSSLSLAYEKGLRSIAFPLISAGIFGYPPDKALEAAKAAVSDFLKEHDMDVFIVLYGIDR